MGTPQFSIPSLDVLIGNNSDVCAVYCQPPRPAGRGKSLRKSPVQIRAESEGLNVQMPTSLKDKESQKYFQKLEADVCFVVAYGLILPKPLLRAPRLGCINAHASLLPRWRGAAPIQRAIMAGDKQTGVSIMQMDDGLDTGPVLYQNKITIEEGYDAGILQKKLSVLSAQLLAKTIGKLDINLVPQATVQQGNPCYAKKIEKNETRLNWRLNAKLLSQNVKAFNPSPGAWFPYQNTKIKVFEAEPVTLNTEQNPGTLIINKNIIIKCGENTGLRLIRLQSAGKKIIDFSDFLRGCKFVNGDYIECPDIN